MAKEQNGVGTRRQSRGNGGFEVIRRREAGGGNDGGLGRIVLPVVIGEQKRSLTVPELQDWISQHSRHASSSEAGAEAPDDERVITSRVAQGESRNDDILAGADHGAGAQVGQFRRESLTEIVDFDQANARRIPVASDNGGVRTGRQRGDNG
ncbi:MAG: hypothetical protein DMF06_07070 [Verrucomicrobia bacterium]|nr:MAG: hypothetical protein DMF06_07070 [Verrucomicrobiota bacterium]